MAKRRKDNIILVIEDDVDIRTFVRGVLELEGYRVIHAATGEEGLKLLRDTQVNLLLLDLRLPDISGWAILEETKNSLEFASIQAIVITASASVSQHDQALAMGAEDYLTKPLSAADLKSAVARVLGAKK